MSIPALALFYGGLVRSKNMLSVLMQVFVVLSLIVILWAIYGYSLAFDGSGQVAGQFSWNSLIGGLGKVMLMGVTPTSVAATIAWTCARQASMSVLTSTYSYSAQ